MYIIIEMSLTSSSDVATDHVPRRLTLSETTLTPVSAGLRVAETREKARPQQRRFRLAHNKLNILARKITLGIDGQLHIQHIIMRGTKLQYSLVNTTNNVKCSLQIIVKLRANSERKVKTRP